MKFRYALRNHDKIKAHFEPHGKEILDRIILSLDKHFAKTDPTFFELIEDDMGTQYKCLQINDEGHSCAIIEFYVLGIKFNVYRLAFKEFIG